MSLGNWGLANPAGLLAGLLVIPILAMHVLRPRRVQQRVAAIFLWRKVNRPVSAAKPWQRLQPSWLLAAQLLAALLLAVLLARPVQFTELPLAEHTIFVVDASGSMLSTDGSPDRIEDARDRARELRSQLPLNGEASLVVAGSNARAIVTRSGDSREFDDALARIETFPGEGDFAGAFALAAGLDTGDRPSRVVLISDGGVDAADLRLAPPGTRYEKIGSDGVNRGISQLTVEPAPGGLVARVTVRHYSGPSADQVVRIDVDGRTVVSQPVQLDAGDVQNLSLNLPTGELIEAFLEPEDNLSLDNRAVATVSRSPEIDVWWVGADDPFLEAALSVIPGVTTTKSRDFVDAMPPETDVVIAHRINVPDVLPAPTWAIIPPDGLPGVVEVTGETQRPALTLIRSDVGLVNGLELSEVLFARSQTIEVTAESQVILGAEGAPLLALTPTLDAPVLYQSFANAESNFPLQAAFPILAQRALTDLTSATVPPARLQLGVDLPLDPRLDALVSTPGGRSFEVAAGSAPPSANRIGFWRIEQEGRVPVVVAVNADSTESSIAPAPALPFAVPQGGEGPETVQGQIGRLWPFVILLLILMMAEWILARRRLGVSQTQWKVATGIRVVVALAVVAVLLGPSFNRQSDKIGAVFLLDASDSLGPAGRSRASQTVGEALAARPDGDVAGVVAFGRDARLEAIVDDDPDFDGLSVQIDATGTDLAAALRLGVAAAPGETRKRLVLVSDGRATTGNVIEEAERLAAENVPVDVFIVDPPRGTDLAIEAIEVPSVARVGEVVTITVRVESPARTPARVELSSDGVLLETLDTELQTGTNKLVFTDIAADNGVLRYTAEVFGLADAVGANNRGFAAVPVAGAQKILVVDGGGNADAADLSRALEAAGLTVDSVGVQQVPGIDELVQYASVILVNVDARDLAEPTVTALTAAVRDLGRGMVVVGGSHSYALGGYRDHPLEEILPVVSEILDPLRRQTVAEVLAIDTSGSMGACHCSENGEANGLGGENEIDGGVKKTSIAQNAAARAINALGATDEVGVISVNNRAEWVIDLQPRPPQEVIDEGLSQLEPDGPTNVEDTLRTAADQLRESEANLKHIIFFSDGFTEPFHLAELRADAADLFDEGITVSVVATGEGAAVDLREIAEAGGGRFYPGKDLSAIPELIVQEAILASRDFINEGNFLPTVTSNATTVSGLASAPPLAGYIATTAKPTARVDLRIGPDEDPLLTSWQVGLGRVSTWASDSGERWGTSWSSWDRAPDFWAGVVKDTFPTAGDGGGVSARIEGDQLSVRIEGVSPWNDDAQASVRVAGPDGVGVDVPLERIDGSSFAAVIPIDEAGTYAIGATVSSGGEAVWSGVGLTSRSYPAEYAPRPLGDDVLRRVADLTGGRFEPDITEIFDPQNTVAGNRRIDLTKWFLWTALLLWPVGVAVSRLAYRSGTLAIGAEKAQGTVAKLQTRLPKFGDPDPIHRPDAAKTPPVAPPIKPAQPVNRSEPPLTRAKARPGAPSPPRAPNAPTRPGATVNELLNRKGGRHEPPS
jgi:Mg-chelatase subunit ChlD